MQAPSLAPSMHTAQDFDIRLTGAKIHQWINYQQLALVCEGGGQRGIFTAGVLDSFMRNDFLPFQTMIGVSAGAQNLSAYASGAQGYARHAILRYTTQKAFFDPLRFARGGHMIDLDWYFDALHQDTPLDLRRAHQRLSGRSLHVCASRCDTLEAEYLPFDTDSLHHSIKASSAIPLFYRGGVHLNGVDYWDGGVSDALPVKAAHDRGSDCIVVIRTMPTDMRDGTLKLPRNLKCQALQQTAAMVESHLKSYRHARAFIDQPPEAVTVMELAPNQPLRSRLLGSSLDALRHDYRMGLRCGRSFMERFGHRLRRRALDA